MKGMTSCRPPEKPNESEISLKTRLKLATNLQPCNHLATDTISRQAAIDALRYAQHRFTVADEAGGIGTVKWSEDVIYFAAAERILTELPSAQPEDCDTCKHGYFGDGKCDNCRVRFPSHYERRADEGN